LWVWRSAENTRLKAQAEQPRLFTASLFYRDLYYLA